MDARSEVRRNFLVVCSDSDRREAIAEAIQKHISKTTFTFAKDGTDAVVKIQNAVPNVIVTDNELSKLSGPKLLDWTLRNAKDKIACLLLNAAPDEEAFVDEVVTGQVQFLEDFTDESKLAKVLSRALNYLSSRNAQEFSLKFLAPKELLMVQGAPAESVYILRRGQLQVLLQHPNGETVSLGTIQQGEFVGEMAYINGEPRSASVEALTDCELIQIPIDQMDHILFQKPAWSKALMKTLSQRVKRTNESRSED